MNKLITIIVLCVSVLTLTPIAAFATDGSIKSSLTGNNNEEKKTEKKEKDMNLVVKLINNGKFLSEKGFKSLSENDIVSISVNSDTICIKVNTEALTSLEKDKDNFVGDIALKRQKPKKQ